MRAIRDRRARRAGGRPRRMEQRLVLLLRRSEESADMSIIREYRSGKGYRHRCGFHDLCLRWRFAGHSAMAVARVHGVVRGLGRTPLFLERMEPVPRKKLKPTLASATRPSGSKRIILRTTFSGKGDQHHRRKEFSWRAGSRTSDLGPFLKRCCAAGGIEHAHEGDRVKQYEEA